MSNTDGRRTYAKSVTSSTTPDAVPQTTAGIQTVKCMCGWESVVICPEENTTLIIKILEHIGQHGISIPKFIIETH